MCDANMHGWTTWNLCIHVHICILWPKKTWWAAIDLKLIIINISAECTAIQLFIGWQSEHIFITTSQSKAKLKRQDKTIFKCQNFVDSSVITYSTVNAQWTQATDELSFMTAGSHTCILSRIRDYRLWPVMKACLDIDHLLLTLDLDLLYIVRYLNFLVNNLNT